MWFLSVFKTEFQKILTYRWEFWLRFLGAALTELGLAYLLWSSLIVIREGGGVVGHSLHWMMVYYAFSFIVQRMAIGEGYGEIGMEVYDGSLTRYLTYPVSYTLFKIAGKSAEFFITCLQLVVILMCVRIWGAEIVWRALPQGLLAAALGSLLYFMMISTVELTAFWADNVWSLSVLVRWTTLLLGGGMLPLFLFPSWAREILEFLPFALVLDFPIRTFVGEIAPVQFTQRMIASIGWLVLLIPLRVHILKRGLKIYTGVGI